MSLYNSPPRACVGGGMPDVNSKCFGGKKNYYTTKERINRGYQKKNLISIYTYETKCFCVVRKKNLTKIIERIIKIIVLLIITLIKLIYYRKNF